ncbi:MAG: cytochrome c-type biogenesis protein [Anaerolineales bacterium]
MNREDAKSAKSFTKFFLAAFASLRLAFLLGLFLALANGKVNAQTPAPSDNDVNRVAKQLYCPVCENIPLDVCPTQACAQWRETIREKLAQGWTDQQIRDYFAEQYGNRVLASPPASGLNVLVWVLPPLALAVGAFILWRFLRGRTRSVAAPSPAPSAPPTNEYAARLEEELKQRR